MAEEYVRNWAHSADQPKVEAVRNLTREDIQDYIARGPAQHFKPLSEAKPRHHRMAKLVALGYDNNEVARICGITHVNLSRLLASPAFVELVEHYRQNVHKNDEDDIDHFKERAKAILDITLDKLQDSVEAVPYIDPKAGIDLATKLMDRLGMSPVKRTEELHAHLTGQEILELKRAARDEEGETRYRILEVGPNHASRTVRDKEKADSQAAIGSGLPAEESD